MSTTARTWAAGIKTGNPTSKAILLTLADFANAKNQCWPAQSSIAEIAECSVDTVQRVLRKFEAMGLITRSKRGSKSGGRMSDVITLVAPGLSRTEPENNVGVKPHSCGWVKPHSYAVGTVKDSPLVELPVSFSTTEKPERERTRKVFEGREVRSDLHPEDEIEWRGTNLTITRSRKSALLRMPAFSQWVSLARDWYAIADAKCAEKGLSGDRAWAYSRTKIAYLAADMGRPSFAGGA